MSSHRAPRVVPIKKSWLDYRTLVVLVCVAVVLALLVLLLNNTQARREDGAKIKRQDAALSKALTAADRSLEQTRANSRQLDEVLQQNRDQADQVSALRKQLSDLGIVPVEAPKAARKSKDGGSDKSTDESKDNPFSNGSAGSTHPSPTSTSSASRSSTSRSQSRSLTSPAKQHAEVALPQGDTAPQPTTRPTSRPTSQPTSDGSTKPAPKPTTDPTKKPPSPTPRPTPTPTPLPTHTICVLNICIG